MISILIPVYNFDVRTFIYELHQQCAKSKIIFEIITVDDASDEKYRQINAELSILENYKHIQLQKNIGRSAIRNVLAESAAYEYLLFADCDSEIPDASFISRYIEQCYDEKVVCGGRTYKTNKPFCDKNFLHWKYGIKREVKTAAERSKYPYRSFMTNNYLISKSIHQLIKFDESISKYGHEDTLFGIELKRKKITPVHINNPLIHINLEDSETIIKKTKQGLENLQYIINTYEYSELYADIKLLKTYKKTKSFSIFLKLFYLFFRKPIEKNLNSRFASLKLFDSYKLTYFHTLMTKKE